VDILPLVPPTSLPRNILAPDIVGESKISMLRSIEWFESSHERVGIASGSIVNGGRKRERLDILKEKLE